MSIQQQTKPDRLIRETALTHEDLAVEIEVLQLSIADADTLAGEGLYAAASEAFLSGIELAERACREGAPEASDLARGWRQAHTEFCRKWSVVLFEPAPRGMDLSVE